MGVDITLGKGKMVRKIVPKILLFAIITISIMILGPVNSYASTDPVISRPLTWTDINNDLRGCLNGAWIKCWVDEDHGEKGINSLIYIHENNQAETYFMASEIFKMDMKLYTYQDDLEFDLVWIRDGKEDFTDAFGGTITGLINDNGHTALKIYRYGDTHYYYPITDEWFGVLRSYPVEDWEYFDCDTLTMGPLDSDGDGLYDIWERRGVDIDGDGNADLRIDKMGADPYIPDVFVEVDWMVRPEQKMGPITIREKESLAPDAASMKKVYRSFKRNGINLHIDVGPDSIDYVTGKKWGSLSGSNVIPYESMFELGPEYSSWDILIAKYFKSSRSRVFHHCMFVNRYHEYGSDKYNSSGKSHGVPAQYFIVANNRLKDIGEFAIAGTFMHELGHNLGLAHGGYNDKDEWDDTKYKPNYLSIMNYLYQFPGLTCKPLYDDYKLDYSQVSLPDLNEYYLLEKNGIDPYKATEEFPYGATFQYKTILGIVKTDTVFPASGRSIDFNHSGAIDYDPVIADINADGEPSMLNGTTPDWPRLEFCGGNISGNAPRLTGSEGMPVDDELSVEEAVKHDALAEPGTGSMEFLGPCTLVADTKGQNVYVRVNNLGSEEATFTLKIKKSTVTDSSSQQLTIPGSTESIEYVDVPIPIKETEAGEYSAKAVLQDSGNEDKILNIPVELCIPTEAEVKQLKQAISEELPEDLEPGVNDELEDMVVRFDTKKWPQPMMIKTTKKTVKYKKLKKKAQKVKPITVKNAEGKVTYKIVGGKSKARKALKISFSTGKITVKKKTKKGTYKVTVRVKAAGTSTGFPQYKSKSKKVTVTVKVK